MRADKQTPKPAPEPTPKEGADIVAADAAVFWYRRGYSDAAHDFMKGVIVGLIVLFTVRLIADNG